MFVNHITATSTRLPQPGPYLYEYVFAGNGVFVRASRPGLEAMIPVTACTLKGLPPVDPYVRIQTRVPEYILRSCLKWSVDALPNEVMFWCGLSDSGAWKVVRPEQYASRASVRPADPHNPFGAQALIDLHSHNTMPPFFSQTDNRDENGFRIYAVIGSIHVRDQKPPVILARVGIYGHFYQFPASLVFDLPTCLRDAYTGDE